MSALGPPAKVARGLSRIGVERGRRTALGNPIGSTRHSGPINERGLDRDGTIAREGALNRVPAAFVPVVEAARAHITETFGMTRLHSAYLYGSIPRGTAIPGISDLDLQLALHNEPIEADRADARAGEAALDRTFPQIDGVGILLTSMRFLLSDVERHDGGFFMACLCTPLLGPDLAERLPRYRPTALLARETNGDLARVLPHWRAKAAETTTDADRRTLSRLVGRRIVRTGFTLIMPRWGRTSDLDQSAELFGRYYPGRVEQMRVAVSIGRARQESPTSLTAGPGHDSTVSAAADTPDMGCSVKGVRCADWPARFSITQPWWRCGGGRCRTSRDGSRRLRDGSRGGSPSLHPRKDVLNAGADFAVRGVVLLLPGRQLGLASFTAVRDDQAGVLESPSAITVALPTVSFAPDSSHALPSSRLPGTGRPTAMTSRVSASKTT